MIRLFKQRPGISVLYNLASVHNRDPLASLSHNPNVMGNEQHRYIELTMNLFDLLQDLILYEDIQASGRFVSDD